jgi:hypothetical protein
MGAGASFFERGAPLYDISVYPYLNRRAVVNWQIRLWVPQNAGKY